MKKDKILGTKKWIFWVSIGIVLIMVYKFLDNFSGIGSWISELLTTFSPFIVGILISYVLYKPCAKIEKALEGKTKKPRRWSIFFVYLISALIVFIILEFIIPALITSVVDLINNAQSYYNSITTSPTDETWTLFIKDNILKPMVDYIQSLDFKQMLTAEKILEYVASAMGIVKFIINIFIAIVCSIYILSERTKIVNSINRFAKATMKKKGYQKFTRYFTSGNTIFFDFISSQAVDSIVVGIIMSVILLILRVKYAVLLGVLIGVFNLIPYFGAIIAVVASALITILTGGWEQALFMTVIIIIAQQIDANIINPRITGSKLNISPLLVIFSVTLGGAYFGIIGMFIAVPIAVLIKLMLEDYIKNKEQNVEE